LENFRAIVSKTFLGDADNFLKVFVCSPDGFLVPLYLCFSVSLSYTERRYIIFTLFKEKGRANSYAWSYRLPLKRTSREWLVPKTIKHLFDFSKSTFEQCAHGLSSLILILPIEYEHHARALFRSEGHNPDDALAVDLVLVLLDVEIAGKLRGNPNDHGRWPCMNTGSVSDRYFSLNHRIPDRLSVA
jgi:hypothetical protein